MKSLFIYIGIFGFSPLFATAEELKLTTPRGAEVNVSTTFPDLGIEKAPVLVIAPGQGYHMDLPLVKDLATKAAQNGFIVYRFNWNYFTAEPQGQPSGDLHKEIEDMQTVIAHAKADSRVDSSRVVIAGKSLGTWVSYPIFVQDNSILGLILMTPICTDPNTNRAIGEESYPALAAQTRPIAMILGNQDPLCSVPMLYDFLKNTKGNVSLNVFAGGHSLTFGKPDDPANAERDAKNIEATVNATAQWARILVGK